MKVAIYVRVSREGQTVENQKLPLIEYCKRMNWDFETFIKSDTLERFTTSDGYLQYRSE